MREGTLRGKRAFSVLMSVYGRESPAFFAEAMQSLVEQSCQPDDIVLVKDGPLGPELAEALREWRAHFEEQLRVINLEEHLGRGEALRIGLEASLHEIVAIMDTDDICVRDRFGKQLKFLESHPDIDLVGSWIAEFKTKPDERTFIRTVAECPDAILRACAHRMPVNHVTVMFRKAPVMRVGSYLTFLGMEDYYLMARMLAQGSRFYNMQEVLVFVRVGAGMQARRGGMKYLINECKLQHFLFNNGLASRRQVVLNILVRAVIRLSPDLLRGMAYKWILRRG